VPAKVSSPLRNRASSASEVVGRSSCLASYALICENEIINENEITSGDLLLHPAGCGPSRPFSGAARSPPPSCRSNYPTYHRRASHRPGEVPPRRCQSRLIDWRDPVRQGWASLPRAQDVARAYMPGRTRSSPAWPRARLARARMRDPSGWGRLSERGNIEPTSARSRIGVGASALEPLPRGRRRARRGPPVGGEQPECCPDGGAEEGEAGAWASATPKAAATPRSPIPPRSIRGCPVPEAFSRAPAPRRV
jgi:hypothetical protein